MSIEFLANISGVEHQSQKMSLCSAKEVTKLEQRIKELQARLDEVAELLPPADNTDGTTIFDELRAILEKK